MGGWQQSCRYCIRKAAKLGLIIEEARDEHFADEYYRQLCDVFAKQSLVPTYNKERIQALIRHLLPTGNLLLLRAREPNGRCIATSIFMGMHEFAYFWGNASVASRPALLPQRGAAMVRHTILEAEGNALLYVPRARESISGNTGGSSSPAIISGNRSTVGSLGPRGGAAKPPSWSAIGGPLLAG